MTIVPGIDAPVLLRHRRLGTEAVYRVLEVGADVVTVEVVRAPGRERGTRMRLMADAARAMERLDARSEVVAGAGRLRPAAFGR
jgi:hypothetical protein